MPQRCIPECPFPVNAVRPRHAAELFGVITPGMSVVGPCHQGSPAGGNIECQHHTLTSTPMRCFGSCRDEKTFNQAILQVALVI